MINTTIQYNNIIIIIIVASAPASTRPDPRGRGQDPRGRGQDPQGRGRGQASRPNIPDYKQSRVITHCIQITCLNIGVIYDPTGIQCKKKNPVVGGLIKNLY